MRDGRRGKAEFRSQEPEVRRRESVQGNIFVLIGTFSGSHLRRHLGVIYRLSIYHGVGWLARERRISASDRHHSERRQRREHGYREGSGVTQGWVAAACLGPYRVRTCTSPILPRLPWRTSWVTAFLDRNSEWVARRRTSIVKKLLKKPPYLERVSVSHW